MLDDFFMRAIIAGIGIALIAGPLGCFVVWQRMSFFGDTLAHAALLGVAFSFLFDVGLVPAAFVVSVLIAGLLIILERRTALPSDALLGLLSHGALAIGLVALSQMPWVRVDVTGLLFGDILAVSKSDIAVIAGAVVLIAIGIFFIWRPLFAFAVDPGIAQAEGLSPERARVIFTILLALLVAVAMKIVGIILITALLIIPAASARRFSIGPEQMALYASLIGIVSVIAGLNGSMAYDTPSGPSIIVASLVVFVVCYVFGSLIALYEKRRSVER